MSVEESTESAVDITEPEWRISVRERDLDNFVVEELRASPSFRKWVFGRLKHCFDAPPHNSINVGKNPKRESEPGQTDIYWSFVGPDGQQLAMIFIENKVACAFMPTQPERYRNEVHAARKKFGSNRAAAVLIAPASNHRVLDSPCFDTSIRIEEIIEHLELRLKNELVGDTPSLAELRERLIARIDLLQGLASKRASTWSANPQPYRVSWFDRYRGLAEAIAPRLSVSASTGGKESTTALFRPKGHLLDGIPLKRIRHDFGSRQRVSAELIGAARAMRAIQEFGLPQNAYLDTTPAGALLIRLDVQPPLRADGNQFDEQRDSVTNAIQMVNELYDWLHSNSAALRKMIAEN